MLDGEQLAWLEGVLAASPDQPTLIAMHHPPLLTGVPAWDAIGLAYASAAVGSAKSFSDIAKCAGSSPVIVHRTIAGELAGRSVLTVPSTYVQGRLDFRLHELRTRTSPPGSRSTLSSTTR